MFSVDHYAISVSNADLSIEFYKKLDFFVIKDWTAPDGSLRIVHLRNGCFILEMFCYKNHSDLPPFVDELESDLLVVGSKHFGLYVEDLESVASYMPECGIISSFPDIVLGRLGRKYFFIKDPDGIFIEIISGNE